MAIDDCYDGYRWLRLRGYEPDQIVLAGDSAGGYLALALAQRLQAEGEEPAALVASRRCCNSIISPSCPPEHPQRRLVRARAFDALVALVARAAARTSSTANPEQIYEPLDHIEPGLPRTLIHVSGSEVLLHDARLAARRLAAAGRAHRGPGVARPDPRLPDGGPAHRARGDPLATPDRRVHPRSHRMSTV
jgi:acetyl esterase/lipase